MTHPFEDSCYSLGTPAKPAKQKEPIGGQGQGNAHESSSCNARYLSTCDEDKLKDMEINLMD